MNTVENIIKELHHQLFALPEYEYDARTRNHAKRGNRLTRYQAMNIGNVADGQGMWSFFHYPKLKEASWSLSRCLEIAENKYLSDEEKIAQMLAAI